MFGKRIVKKTTKKVASKVSGLAKKHPRLYDENVREAFENKPPKVEDVKLTAEEEEIILQSQEVEDTEVIPEIEDIRHSIGVDEFNLAHLHGYNKQRKAKGRARKQYESLEKNRRHQQFGRLDPLRDFMIEYIIEAANEAAEEARKSYSAEYTDVVEHNILKVSESLLRLVRQASKKSAPTFKKSIKSISNKTTA